MPITHLPAQGYRRMRWKNGAGTTTEIAVSPPGAGLDEFEWRLAIADLERPGPFSSFPGVERLLMVLPPGEVALTIDGTERALPPLEVLRFAGESVVSASLAAGPARDLNLMLRRGRVDAGMGAVTLEGKRRLPLDGRRAVLCSIEGSVHLELGGERSVLRPLDSAIVVSDDPEAEVTVSSDQRAVFAHIRFRPPNKG
jgi:environmental stress-induced protein Ves